MPVAGGSDISISAVNDFKTISITVSEGARNIRISFKDLCGGGTDVLISEHVAPDEEHVYTFDVDKDGIYVVEASLDFVTKVTEEYIRIDNTLKAVGYLYSSICDDCGNCVDKIINGNIGNIYFVVSSLKNALGICGNGDWQCDLQCIVKKITQGSTDIDVDIEKVLMHDYMLIYAAAVTEYGNTDLVKKLMRYDSVEDCLGEVGVGNIEINITANRAPSNVPDVYISLEAGQSYTFNLADFTTGYVDPEGDSIAGIKIMSSPVRGDFYVDGVKQVVYPFEVTASQIAGGNFKFVDDANASTEISFDITYVAKDSGSGNYSY